MPHYISLVKWTDKGAQEAKESAQRIGNLLKFAEQHGAKIQVFSTMGAYDFVAIAEAPNDETAMLVALRLESAGNARTQTMKAWPLEEAAKILANL